MPVIPVADASWRELLTLHDVPNVSGYRTLFWEFALAIEPDNSLRARYAEALDALAAEHASNDGVPNLELNLTQLTVMAGRFETRDHAFSWSVLSEASREPPAFPNLASRIHTLTERETEAPRGEA